MAGAIDAGRGDPGGELVSNRGEVCERGLEPSLGLSPGLLGWEMSRTVGPAGGSGAAGFCGGGRGSQGRRRGAGGGLRGMPSKSKEGARPKSSRGPRGGVRRLHAFGPSVQQAVSGRDAGGLRSAPPKRLQS